MEKNTDHLWIFSSRPKSIDEMLLTDEMENIINSSMYNHTLINGPIGTGKTVLAEAITKFSARIVNCKSSNEIDELFKNADEINSVIIKNIDKCYDRVDEILEVYKMKKIIFITRDEASSDLSIFKNCKIIHTNQFLPKNNHSLKKFQNYLSKLLKTNQIGFDSSNDQFQLNTLEMYEKLWPRMRQIVRHAQMRSKSNKWVPIPV
ncbi:MAG: hypothetical protein CMQ60_04755 [Gammaproteobacteria bacterium]|nr:hypothetical protein [Gammaproteobacteria bacterium]